MQWLMEFLSANRNYVALSVAVVLSLTMLSLEDSDQVAVVVKGTPSGILRMGRRLFSWATSISQLSRENHYLRRQNLKLALDLWTLKEAELENVRIRRLLGFRERSAFSYVPARIIAQHADRGVRSVEIDVGTKDGVGSNMTVVTTDGLAGRVFRADSSTSIVQLLLDRNCRVSAVVQNRERTVGIFAYDYDKGVCYLKNVKRRSDVKKGDIVVSSGVGGVFPKGFRIGTVERSEGESKGLFRQVVVRPSVRFAYLEEVFVLLPE